MIARERWNDRKKEQNRVAGEREDPMGFLLIVSHQTSDCSGVFSYSREQQRAAHTGAVNRMWKKLFVNSCCLADPLANISLEAQNVLS